LSTIRDRCAEATAVKKADKIKGKTKEVYQKLKGVIARQRADELEKESNYLQNLQSGQEEKKTDGVAYDLDGNLIDPMIVDAARVAELDETRPPEQSKKDRESRRLLLKKNELTPNSGNLLHSRAIPSVDLTSMTKEKTSKNNQDSSSQGDESLNPDKQPDSTSKPSDDPATASDDSKTNASDDPNKPKINDKLASSPKRPSRVKQPPSKYADEQAAEQKNSAEKAAEKEERKRKRRQSPKATKKKYSTNEFNAEIEDESDDLDPNDFEDDDSDN
jgi:hypothetical protein